MHSRSVVRTFTSVRLQCQGCAGVHLGSTSLGTNVPEEALCGFALGPRKKYVDIVTDTLHASSSDLLTWNTLVMMKLGWVNSIPRVISGTVVPPDGTRLPAAGAPGNTNYRNGMDQSGLHRLQGPWVVPSMIQIKSGIMSDEDRLRIVAIERLRNGYVPRT